MSAMSLLSQLAPLRTDMRTTIAVAGSSVMGLPGSTSSDAPSESLADRRPFSDAEDLTRILLSDGTDDVALARLQAGVDENVDVWTPALHTTSRFDLVSALVDVDDAIADVRVTFTESSHAQSTTFLGWKATGRFARPAFLDDDHLLEPSGAVIRLAGATSVSFTAGRRADRIRCYYDRLGLIEQLLGPRPVAKGD